MSTLHNPFFNRFNDPVNRRKDEMQSDAYCAWLRERNRGIRQTTKNATQMLAQESTRLIKVIAGVFGVLLLIVSAALMLKSM